MKKILMYLILSGRLTGGLLPAKSEAYLGVLYDQTFQTNVLISQAVYG